MKCSPSGKEISVAMTNAANQAPVVMASNVRDRAPRSSGERLTELLRFAKNELNAFSAAFSSQKLNA